MTMSIDIQNKLSANVEHRRDEISTDFIPCVHQLLNVLDGFEKLYEL